MAEDHLEPLFSAKEVDSKIRIPAPTVRRMHLAGLINGYRVGEKQRGVRFRISEILAAIKVKPIPNQQDGTKAATTTGPVSPATKAKSKKSATKG